MSGILHKTRFRLRDDARLIDDPRSVWPLPKIGSLTPKLIARADDDSRGVDIGYERPDPRGDLYVPVHAVQSGIIVYAAPGSTGHAVTIDHGSWASHYAHLARLVIEFLRFRWLSDERKAAIVRVENIDLVRAVHARGKGVLILTGHFGNWEVATIAGVRKVPEAHGRFHFVRRAIKPRWLESLVTRRFQRAGFGVLPKRGSLDALVERSFRPL